jgi:hypothetical protein
MLAIPADEESRPERFETGRVSSSRGDEDAEVIRRDFATDIDQGHDDGSRVEYMYRRPRLTHEQELFIQRPSQHGTE